MSDALRTGDDPTKAVLSKSKKYDFWLCDYVINVANGCRHGCGFCYVPTTPQTTMRGDMLEERVDVDDPQEEWGRYLLRRDPDETERKLRKTLENKRTWKTTRSGRGVVWLSSGTDCYQDSEVAETTRRCIAALLDHGKPVRVLTRNPLLATQDMALFERGAEKGLLTVGASIPTLDDDLAGVMEPDAPAPSARLRGLERFADRGVPTFVSMSPTYPVLEPTDVHELLATFANRLDTLDVVFHEAINPRGSNYTKCIELAHEAGYDHLAGQLDRCRDRDVWVHYVTEQLLAGRHAARELGVPLKSWPGKGLVRHAEGRNHEFAARERWRASPETFPTGVDL